MMIRTRFTITKEDVDSSSPYSDFIDEATGERNYDLRVFRTYNTNKSGTGTQPQNASAYDPELKFKGLDQTTQTTLACWILHLSMPYYATQTRAMLQHNTSTR